MTTPETQYYEDVVVGVPQRFGAYLVTREEVIDFASRYDPQDFHLGDEAAARGPFGTLAASGWNTAAISMRLLCDHLISRQASLGGAGVEEIRWTRPVLPGDVLSLEITVTEKRRSRSRPEVGLMKIFQRMFNQHDEEVMRLSSTGMIKVRDPAAPIEA